MHTTPATFSGAVSIVARATMPPWLNPAMKTRAGVGVVRLDRFVDEPRHAGPRRRCFRRIDHQAFGASRFREASRTRMAPA